LQVVKDEEPKAAKLKRGILEGMRNTRFLDRVRSASKAPPSTFLRSDDSIAAVTLNAIGTAYATIRGSHGDNREVEGVRMFVRDVQGLFAENPQVIATPAMQCLFVVAVHQKWCRERLIHAKKDWAHQKKWVVVDGVSESNYNKPDKELFLLDAFQPRGNDFEYGKSKPKLQRLYHAMLFVFQHYPPKSAHGVRFYQSPDAANACLNARPGRTPLIGCAAEQASILYAYENWERLAPGAIRRLDMLITDDKPDTVEIDGTFLPKAKSVPGKKPVTCGVFVKPRRIREWAKGLDGSPLMEAFFEFVRGECEWHAYGGPECVADEIAKIE